MKKWPVANQEQILCSYQKDQHYFTLFQQKALLALESVLPYVFYAKHQKLIDASLSLVYLLINLPQSIGQEYTDYLYKGKIISGPRKVLFGLISFLYEFLIDKHKKIILNKWILALFMITGSFVWSKIMNIKSIQIIPLKQEMNLKFIGILYLIQLIYELKDTIVQHYEAKNKKDMQKLPQSAQQNSSISCSLCLDQAEHASTIPCGHIFCWNCLQDALNFKDECPECRAYCTLKNMVQLRNI